MEEEPTSIDGRVESLTEAIAQHATEQPALTALVGPLETILATISMSMMEQKNLLESQYETLHDMLQDQARELQELREDIRTRAVSAPALGSQDADEEP
eukprot:1163781-Prymnesium_polylepis.2